MDPLAKLRDIEIPLEPVWWPPAPGWWLLAGLLLLLIIYLRSRYRNRINRRQPFKQARSMIMEHNAAFAAQQLGPVEYVEELNRLLKRSALHAASKSGPEFQVAPLSGKCWLEYLDTLSSSTEFTDGAGKVLGDQRYQENVQSDLSNLHLHVARLIRKLEQSA